MDENIRNLQNYAAPSVFDDEKIDFYQSMLSFKRGVIPIDLLQTRFYDMLSFSVIDNTGMNWATSVLYDPRLKELYRPLNNRHHRKEDVIDLVIKSKKEMRNKALSASSIIISYYEEFIIKSVDKYGPVYNFEELKDVLTTPPPYRFHYNFVNNGSKEQYGIWRGDNGIFGFDAAVHCLVTYGDLGSLYIGIECKEHGRFTVTANKHLKNGFCPECKKLLFHISSGAQAVKDTLVIMGVTYEQEFPLKKIEATGPSSQLRFDFFIPSLNAAIEYDGEQHFRPVEQWGGEKSFKKTIERDTLKNEFCKINNIYLLRIPYTSSTVSKEVYSFINELVS